MRPLEVKHGFNKKPTSTTSRIKQDVVKLDSHEPDASFNNGLRRKILTLSLLQRFTTKHLECERNSRYAKIDKFQPRKLFDAGRYGLVGKTKRLVLVGQEYFRIERHETVIPISLSHSSLRW